MDKGKESPMSNSVHVVALSLSAAGAGAMAVLAGLTALRWLKERHPRRTQATTAKATTKGKA